MPRVSKNVSKQTQCLRQRKKTGNKNPEVIHFTVRGVSRYRLSSTCDECGCKKNTFLASGTHPPQTVSGGKIPWENGFKPKVVKEGGVLWDSIQPYKPKPKMSPPFRTPDSGPKRGEIVHKQDNGMLQHLLFRTPKAPSLKGSGFLKSKYIARAQPQRSQFSTFQAFKAAMDKWTAENEAAKQKYLANPPKYTTL